MSRLQGRWTALHSCLLQQSRDEYRCRCLLSASLCHHHLQLERQEDLEEELLKTLTHWIGLSVRLILWKTCPALSWKILAKRPKLLALFVCSSEMRVDTPAETALKTTKADLPVDTATTSITQVRCAGGYCCSESRQAKGCEVYRWELSRSGSCCLGRLDDRSCKHCMTARDTCISVCSAILHI